MQAKVQRTIGQSDSMLLKQYENSEVICIAYLNIQQKQKHCLCLNDQKQICLKDWPLLWLYKANIPYKTWAKTPQTGSMEKTEITLNIVFSINRYKELCCGSFEV